VTTTRSAGPRLRSPGRAARWRGGRRSVASAGALLVLASGLVLGGPAPAADAAACSGTTGVTVVVDYGSLGGGVRTGCTGGNPGSGLSALTAAGHSYSFVPRFVGLVCQIDARPNPCNGAPSSAYWSYWHAERGKGWSYSQEGAGTYHPAPGTVEGWAFGAGRQPAIAPPVAPAPPPPPAPKPTTKPAPKPTAQPPAPPRGSAPGGGAPPAPGSSRGASRPANSASAAGTSAHRTTAAPSTSAGPTATDGVSTGAAGAPSTADSAPPGSAATEPASSSSRTLGTFALAVALIAALGLAGFLIARRRRGGPPI
jgi:hypothetical protein